MSKTSGYLVSPARDYVSVTLADADLPNGVCRGILSTTAGTVNLMTSSGDIRVGVPLQQGYNPLVCRQIRTGGSATGLFALY